MREASKPLLFFQFGMRSSEFGIEDQARRCRGPAMGSSAARGSALTFNLRSDQGIAPYARLRPFRARSAEHPNAREACDDPSSACSAFLRSADSFRFRRAMPGAAGKDPSTRPADLRSHDSVGEGLAPSRRSCARVRPSP